METVSINKIMDEIYDIVNTAPAADVVSHVTRCAGRHDPVASIEALARLLVIEHTRRVYTGRRESCPH